MDIFNSRSAYEKQTKKPSNAQKDGDRSSQSHEYVVYIETQNKILLRALIVAFKLLLSVADTKRSGLTITYFTEIIEKSTGRGIKEVLDTNNKEEYCI